MMDDELMMPEDGADDMGHDTEECRWEAIFRLGRWLLICALIAYFLYVASTPAGAWLR